MLPVQPYHEGSYPPGARFPQFGDDVVGGYLNAHAALAEKRRNMVPFHIGRLAQDGFLPLNHLPSQVPASPANPEDQATQAFDGFDRPTPSAPPGHGTQEHGPISPQPEQHYIGDAADADDGGDLDVPQASRSGRLLSGVARLAGNGALSLGGLLVKGVARGAMTAVDLAAGVNHMVVPPEDRPHIEDEPVQGSWFYPGPKKPQRKFVDASPYNGTGDHAIPISSDEEEAPGPAAAARRPRNSVRKSDVELARQTLGGLGPNFGRGHRNR